MRRFMPMLFLAGSAVTVGLAVGYYAAMTGEIAISQGAVIILALTLVGLLAAFYAGRTPVQANAESIVQRDPWAALRLEFDRSRRFERPFVLVRFSDPTTSAADGTGRSDSGETASTLPMMVRGIDRVWSVGGSTYVLLPESRRESAEALIARLRPLTRNAALLDHAEMAEFPADGLTASALMTSLAPAASPPDVETRVWLVRSGDAVDAERDEQTG
ncbi:MAG TPA: hypothetical protein VFN76_05025 [Candidatus Limnocylindria bacterium]|nr:hypothetical protein [Candidatus Limnocylindria bacterium]